MPIAAMVWVPVQYTPSKASNEAQSAVTVARGEYVMRAANGLACHTADEGQPFAGERKIESPLGTIYSTNIIPDQKTGIGAYSLDEFRASLYDGLRKDGAHLYPAKNHRFLSEADVQSMYLYFMQEVPAVYNKVLDTALKFPFNQRRGLRAWNELVLQNVEFKPVSDNAQLNRGGYLVQGHAWRLSDAEVAALATFVRQGWHNQVSAVSASAVKPLR